MPDGIAQNCLIFHVSVTGCDRWSGFVAEPDMQGNDGPLATIAGAKERIRSIRKEGKLKSAVEVLIHAGLYQITETLNFSPDDLGSESTMVTYRAAGDGEVRLTGGVSLKGFVHYRNKILKLDLAETGYAGINFQHLFCNGVRQRTARYPGYNAENPYGSGWLYVEGTAVSIYENGHGNKDRFICNDLRLKTWTNIQDIEVVIFPRYNYTNDIIRIKSYDADTGEIILDRPAVYEIYPGDRFYFQNVLEELDEVGEWYLDKKTSSLYFYPPDFFNDNSTVTISMLENIIELNGEANPGEDLYAEKIDWRDSGGELRLIERPLEIVKGGYINFQGITIEGCDCAGILMRNVHTCNVKGCTVKNTGGAGIIILGGLQCCVSDSDIFETGSYGIYLSGGLRSPFCRIYESCFNEAVNNYIHHVGTIYKSVAGIAINGVGISVAHNLIHDGPRWGIISRGNNNLIEYNHIRHVNIETSDTAAIYLVDRDLSMHGTRIQYNHIHDILGYHCIDGVWHSPALAFGIYLDDWTSGVEVHGNLIYRTPAGGMYVHAGQDNIVENNMFLETKEEMALFRMWEPDVEYSCLGTHGLGFRHNVFRKNILSSRSSTACVYRFDNLVDSNDRLDVYNNTWDDNVIWHYGLPITIKLTNVLEGNTADDITFEQWRSFGFDHGSVINDPLFENIESDNFHLRENSPAFKLGFKPLPIEKMGPYKTEHRVNWPIIEAEGAREHPLV